MSDPDDPGMAGLDGATADQAIDPAQLEMTMARLRGEQSLGGAVWAGGLGAVAGAAAWAGVTVVTGYQIGWMAVGVGFGVGYAVRFAGKGIDRAFGAVGAAWSVLGCAAGNLLAICGLVAKEHGVAWADVVTGLDAAMAGELMAASFTPMDLVFYGIAVYEGYRFSFRRLTAAELDPYGGGPLGGTP